MNQKGFTSVILIAILVVFVGAVGYFIFKNPPPVAEEPTPSPSQNQVTTTTSTPSADQTANWKTYRNAKYGFEVKYPERWQYDLAPDEEGIFLHEKSDGQENPSMAIRALPLYKGRSIKEIRELEFINFQQDCKNTSFAGDTHAYDCSPAITFAGERDILFVKDRVPFRIFDSLLNDKSKMIISTFTFIK